MHQRIGQKLGCSSRKVVRVPIGVLGGGVWGRVQVGGLVGFPIENEGKRRRDWGGVRTLKGTGKSMRTRCQNYP